MAHKSDFDDLIVGIYDSAADPARYPDVAKEISQFIGADGAALVLHTTDTQQVLKAEMVNYDHLTVDEIFMQYGRDWHGQNPQVLFERAHPKSSIYFEGCDATFNSAIYSEFSNWNRSATGIRSQLTGYCRPSDRLTYAFAFSLHDDDRPKSNKQLELLAELMRHLRQSVALAYRIGTLEQRCEALLDHLQALRGAVIILDSDGSANFVNEAMAALLRNTGSLALRNRRLTAASPRANKKLQEILGRAIGPPGAAGAMMIGHAGGGRPLLVQAAPLTGSFHAFGLERGAAIVTILGSERHRASAALFRAAFGLTPTEAEVATYLMKGSPDEEIATAFGVSVNTIRSHVRAILDKTHLRSKAELAHVLTAMSR